MIKYGYFDSVDGDRTYNGDDLNRIFEGVCYPSFGSGLACYKVSTKIIAINSGVAYFMSSIAGFNWFRIDEDTTVDITTLLASASNGDYVFGVNFDATTRSAVYVLESLTNYDPTDPDILSLAHVAVSNHNITEVDAFYYDFDTDEFIECIPSVRNLLNSKCISNYLTDNEPITGSINFAYDGSNYGYQGRTSFNGDTLVKRELKLTSDSYGDTLPATNLYDGRLFFLQITE